MWGSKGGSGSGAIGELSTLPSVASSSDHFDLVGRVCLVEQVDLAGEQKRFSLPPLCRRLLLLLLL